MLEFTAELTFLALGGAVAGLLLGGVSKGLLGIGLPLISVPLLVTFLPVHDALAVMMGPTLVTNFWQALQGGNPAPVIRRFWPLLLALPLGILAGTHLLASLNEQHLLGIVGGIVVVLSVVSLLHPAFHLPERLEKSSGVLAGTVAGMLLGVALHMGPLLALYFVSLRMAKDEFVRALGVAFAFGVLFTITFYVAYGIFEARHIVPTLTALVPVVIGNWVGQKLRRHVAEAAFRKGMFIALIVIGANLVRRSLM